MYRIMQHVFGENGSGGPVNAYHRLLAYSQFNYSTIKQLGPARGINLSIIFNFIKDIKKNKPTLIHIRGLGNEGFHAVIAAKICGVPNILVSIHGTHRDLVNDYHPIKKWIIVNILENITLHFATDIVTVCHFANGRRFLKPYSNKLRPPIPNGVPIPQLLESKSIDILKDKLNIDRNVKRVGICVSRITIEKGYLVLADALKMIDKKENSFTLLVLGSGDKDNTIKTAYSNLKYIEVKFIGQVTNVGHYLSISDFFIFPTLHENLSNALIEAMSYSLPVIATSAGGNTEVIRQGGGILVKPNEPKSLALAIEELINNPHQIYVLGREARENIIANYSVESMVESWENLYSKIIEAQDE